MKVLVVTGIYPPEIGGPATYARLLETGLPGHHIVVEVLKFRDVRRYPPVIRHIALVFWIIRRGWGADVLYALDTMSVGVPVWAANIVLRKKVIVRVPGDHVWEQGTQRFGIVDQLDTFPRFSWSWHPYLMLMRAFQNMVMRGAHVIVVPSLYMARIVGRWGVPEKKVKLIYNGVSIGDVGNRDTIRGVLHFEGRLLISVGRLVPWKGFDALIRVFARLKRKKFPDLTLFIAGAGPELDKLMDLARAQKVEESVIFAGVVDHDALLRYIRASDVFVLNTSYEGLSHLLLETLAVGVPIVTTNIGGNPEVVTDNVDGFLVAPNDQSAIESRIITLLEKKDVASRIVRAGLTRAASFRDERVVEENVALIRAVLS